MDAGDVAEWLARWRPTPQRARVDGPARDEVVSFLRQHPDGLQRTCRTGHLTASAFVVDVRSWRSAVVYHGIAQRWLQPGGHVEASDIDVAAAAAREAREETGLDVVVDPRPLRIDIHAVRCRDTEGRIGPSRHFDVGMLALTGVGVRTQPGPDPVVWWDLFAPNPGDPTMERLRHAAAERLGYGDFSTGEAHLTVDEIR